MSGPGKESDECSGAGRRVLAEHADLELRLADPEVLADQTTARKLGRRYAEIGPIVAAARELADAREDEAAARELAAEDPTFAIEAKALTERVTELETRLAALLVPRDPHDGDDIVLEVKSGEGGEESALFAGDLVRMYTRYAERRGWSVEVLDSVELRPGRLQGHHAVGARSRFRPRRRVVGAEVRGRRAPGAAGAGHRIPGTGAHLRGGCARLPRHRGGGHDRDRRQRPAGRRVPLLRPRAGRA